MINHRAESACYTIMRRVAPVLRHDVAGLMQPVRLLVTVLERRLMKPDFDLGAAQENIANINQLTKQASAGFIDAIGWMGMDDNTLVDLSSGIDELLKLLAVELNNAVFSVFNEIPKDKLNVSQRFIRTVLAGIVLAFYDQRTDQSELRIGFVPNTNDKQLQSLNSGSLLLSIVMSADINANLNANLNAKSIEPSRSIDWDDVDALAQLFDTTVSREASWLRIDLPNFKIVS